MPVLEKENDYKDEHFDFMQYHLRKFCLECKRTKKTLSLNFKKAKIIFRRCCIVLHIS